MSSLTDISLFMLDRDGTIYLGDRLFDCTKPFLETVRRTGRRYIFLTNNSSKDRTAYVEKLGRLGIAAAPDDVFTSGEATTIYMRRAFPGAKVCVMGMPTLEREFREAGFTLVERDPDCLVLGFDQAFDYAKMTRLCDIVRAGTPRQGSPDKAHPLWRAAGKTHMTYVGFAGDVVFKRDVAILPSELTTEDITETFKITQRDGNSFCAKNQEDTFYVDSREQLTRLDGWNLDELCGTFSGARLTLRDGMTLKMFDGDVGRTFPESLLKRFAGS